MFLGNPVALNRVCLHWLEDYPSIVADLDAAWLVISESLTSVPRWFRKFELNAEVRNGG
jgi:hypothetical protein